MKFFLFLICSIFYTSCLFAQEVNSSETPEEIEEAASTEPTIYKDLPPEIYQEFGDQCWAAALESWLAAVGRKRIPMDTLKNKFASYTRIYETVNPNYVLKEEHLKDVAADPEVNMDLFDIDISKGPGFVDKMITDQLKSGVIYATRLPTSGVGHVVVIYGIGYPDGKTRMLSYMDPLISPNGYVNKTVPEFIRFLRILKFGSPM